MPTLNGRPATKDDIFRVHKEMGDRYAFELWAGRTMHFPLWADLDLALFNFKPLDVMQTVPMPPHVSFWWEPGTLAGMRIRVLMGKIDGTDIQTVVRWTRL